MGLCLRFLSVHSLTLWKMSEDSKATFTTNILHPHWPRHSCWHYTELLRSVCRIKMEIPCQVFQCHQSSSDLWGCEFFFGMLESIFPCMNQQHSMNGGLDWKPDQCLGHCRHVPPTMTNDFFFVICLVRFSLLATIVWWVWEEHSRGCQDLKFPSKLHPFTNIVNVLSSHFSAVWMLWLI